jgi:hypothetical protein
MNKGRLMPGAGSDFGRSSAISLKISWNICRGMATSAIWKATVRPWLTTLAPILISFSFRLDSDQSLTGSAVASVRKKLPRLWASAHALGVRGFRDGADRPIRGNPLARSMGAS